MAVRLSRRDAVALTLFVVVWAVLFTVKVSGAAHPLAQPVAVEAAAPNGYPVVRALLRPAPHRSSLLLVKDQVIAIGADDMRGRGQLGVLLAFSRAGTTALRQVPVVIKRAGVRQTLLEPMPFKATAKYWLDLVVSLILGTTAVLILLRARSSVASRALFQALVVDALLFVVQFDASPAWYSISMTVGILLATISSPTLVRAALAFPEEAHGLDGAWRWLPIALLPLGVPIFSAYYGFPIDPVAATSLSRIGVLAFIIAFVAALTRNVRRSGPVGKRQAKWLLYSVYVSALIAIPEQLLTNVAEMDPPVWSVVALGLAKAVFPITVLIASLRYDLLDINRLFGVTVLYNVLAALALGAGFLIVPRAADAMTSGLDIGRQAAQTILTIGLAAIVLLVGRRMRGAVERRFFGERYALEAAMRDLPERFAAVRRADELWDIVGRELSSILRPSSCVVFTSAGDAFVPVFSDADSRAPLLPASSTLLTWALALHGAHRIQRRDREQIGPLGIALLEELDCQIVVPVHRQGTLEALICLGEKRSGDIYTATDEALLTALGKTLSSHMLRFDEAELLERAQAMQQRMRRYVPGALADVIADGEEIETGEREVSVLFVDIRGYTAYADGRDAREIFSTVNRYTEAVSSIVREEGGVVVEFNGDGMMAVFGAPRPLPYKETAAVRAGARLAREIPALAADAALFVGVGIATGMAFVGNIEAVDRTIWSAIGNTTNLAARLQTHTRVVSASVLIDERTWSNAGNARDGFVRLDPLKLRGRRDAETVFALTLPNAPSPTLLTPMNASTVAAAEPR